MHRIEAEPVADAAQEVRVRMRDGIELATDIYLPEGREPTQTVLVRQPYDKASRYTFFTRAARFFIERGYALAVQDVRGKFRSGGATVPYVSEVADGYDTIDWIVKQGWSDGRVGMFGDSYYGFTQWAALASGHPALRAIVPRMTSVEIPLHRISFTALPYENFTGQTGGWIRNVQWLEGIDYLAHYWVDNCIYEYEVDWSHRPLATVFDEAFAEIGRRSAAFDMAVPYPVPPLHWPTGHPFDARPIPTLHVVGWFDTIAIPAMRDYMALASRPEWAPVTYLSVDSVDHENHHLTEAPIAEENEHETNDEALERLLPRYLQPALDFFDVFLRGSHCAENLARVSWNLGHAGWRTAATWPPPEASPRTLFLVPGRGIHDGRLSPEAPHAPATIEWRHDPENLVPSAVTNSFAFLAEYPDERKAGQRDDVLVFTGDRLQAPVDLAGPVTLHVSLRSTARTADVFAKLLDVDPSGAARMIVRGQAQADTRDGPRSMFISLGHTGYRVRVGHRLRLHLASSDYPLYLPNSGTSENPWLAVTGAVSTQSLVFLESEPPFLTLSMLSGDA